MIAKSTQEDINTPSELAGQSHSTIAVPANFGRRPASFRVTDLLLTAPFILLFLVQLARHEMWRDELNAFGIAMASPNLSSLAWHIHYEGHPWLWYFLVWVVSRFTASAIGLKVLQAAVGTAIYLIIGVGSPFSRVEKVLIFFCYFISFEYTVISRMYGVTLLLMLIYIRQRALYPQRVTSGALLLGLMASTDVMGMLLSAAFFVEFYFSALTAQNGPYAPSKRQLTIGACLYFGITALAVVSLIPAPDMSWRTTGHPFEFAASGEHLMTGVVRYVVLPYFPIFQPGSFWNAFAQHRTHRFIYFALFVPLVLGAYYFIFRRHRNLLLMMAVTTASAIAFGHLVYMGSLRHYGITFLAFFAGIWLLRSRVPRLPWIAYAMLSLTAAGGVYAGFQAWQRPFSNAGPTAKWLKANHLETATLVGTPDTLVASIAELLNRPIYMLDCRCSDKFLLFSNRRDDFTQSQIPERLGASPAALHVSKFVYLASRPFNTDEESSIRSRGITIKPLASFTGAQVDENFYIYEASVDQHSAP